MTLAPAERSARVVSRPMPEEPPVTMAILPLKSRPRMTSLAVVEAPKPEPMGVCWVNRRNLLENVRKAWFNLSELYLTVRTVTPCHPERSEGSDSPGTEILRCAQDDRAGPFR